VAHHHHDHSHHLPAASARSHLRLVVLAVAVAAIVGAIVLWPRGAGPDRISNEGFYEVDATVDLVTRDRCPSIELPSADTMCQIVTFTVTDGITKGERASFEVRDIDYVVPDLHPGDELVLRYTPTAPAPYRYYFWDFQRDAPMLVLAAMFMIVVVSIGRGLGLRALIGLVLSLGVVLWFTLPSLLRANNALGVALVSTTLIAFAALYLAHGFRASTTVALLGTLSGLVVIVVLAAVFIGWADLTGLSDESAQVLRVTADAIDPRGLLLAGTVIGALGVLDDITVTQVAAVLELRSANPQVSSARLYRQALRIGRDHIASTVNTLILAYVGASLPLLLYFTQSDQSAGRVATREVVASEIIRTLAGSIGLVLAVPATTALAVYLLHAPEPDAVAGPATPDRPSWDDFAPRDHEPRA
jgi:uncharacterized membrane protein